TLYGSQAKRISVRVADGPFPRGRGCALDRPPSCRTWLSLTLKKRSAQMTTNSLVQYYRCPEVYGGFQSKGSFSGTPKYFRFGKEVICYGTYFDNQTPDPTGTVFDASLGVELKDGMISLPFDPSEVIDNLRCEKYVKTWRYKKPLSTLTDIYYLMRPFLPVNVRRQLQKLYLRDWRKIPFPRWPVDTSVDGLMRQLLLLSIRSSGLQQIP